MRVSDWTGTVRSTLEHGAQKLFGLFTRAVAFLLCGEMAGAYFPADFPRGFWPMQNGGEISLDRASCHKR